MRSALGGPRRTLVLAGVAVHVLLLVVSALLYPGGTWWNKAERGFDLTQNFWCDLLRPVSHGGVDNPWGSLVGRLALLVLALTGSVFWGVVARSYEISPLSRRCLNGAGWIGCVALSGVAFAAGKQAAWLHHASIVYLGPFGVVALVWSVGLSIARGRPITRLLGLGAAGFSLWNMIQYVRQTEFDAADWTGLPLVQRIATLFVLAWMVAIVWRPGPD